MASSAASGLASSARRRGQGSKKRAGNGPTHYVGGRNIVFMVGGLSFAELRVIRDVMERESREIIAGATKFISPGEFIDDLKTLTEYWECSRLQKKQESTPVADSVQVQSSNAITL